jgi:hypothetical protein
MHWVLPAEVTAGFVALILRSRGPTTPEEATCRRLSAELRRARRKRITQQLTALRADLLTRARGGGSWSIEASFDGEDGVLLGQGSPCEESLAAAVQGWVEKTARTLGVPAHVHAGSDC